MKILHLEDNAADAELAHRVLCSAWPDCQVALVDNRPDFLAALARGRHDLPIRSGRPE